MATYYLDTARGAYLETDKAIGFPIVTGATNKPTGEVKWFPKSKIDIQFNDVSGWESPDRVKIIVPAWTVKEFRYANQYLDSADICMN